MDNQAIIYSMRLLARVEKSELELRKKMENKNFSPEEIDEAMNYLKKNKYQDDYRYAVCFTKDKRNFTGAGKKLIRQKLKEKGVSTDIIDQVFDEIINYEDELLRAKKLVEKKLERSRNQDDLITVNNKLVNFLVQKGYDFSLAIRVVREMVKTQEDEFDAPD